MAKKQTEVPGTERESIEEIDECVATHLQAKADAKKYSEHAKEAKAAMLQSLQKHVEALETDAAGDHIYPYVDGDQEFIVVLDHGDSVRIRNAKKAQPEPSGDIDG